jgi:hypothetical protein
MPLIDMEIFSSLVRPCSLSEKVGCVSEGCLLLRRKQRLFSPRGNFSKFSISGKVVAACGLGDSDQHVHPVQEPPLCEYGEDVRGCKGHGPLVVSD